MTQKRSSLTASLVATKGAAAPATDAPTRAPVAAPLTPVEDVALVPLNFRVSPDFRRRFKVYAAQSGRSMVEIMQEAVEREMQK